MTQALWNAKGFEKLTDPDKIRRLLQKAAQEEAPVVLWFLDQGDEPPLRFHLEEVTRDAQAPELVVLRLSLSAGVKKGKLRKPSEPCRLGVFKRNSGVIAFPTRWLRLDGSQADVEFPSSVYFLQRRKTPRLEIPGAYELYACFGIKRSYRILDLSEEGFSFLVPPEEKDDFRVGRKLRGCSFRIRSQDLGAELEIKNVRAAPAEGGFLRVGASFSRMLQEDREFVLSYVIEHLIQYSQTEIPVRVVRR